MDDPGHMLLTVFVANVAIWIIQFGLRFIVRVGKWGESGIYLMLLPIGFNCMGVGFPPWMIAITTVLGLVQLLWAMRSRQRELLTNPAGS